MRYEYKLTSNTPLGISRGAGGSVNVTHHMPSWTWPIEGKPLTVVTGPQSSPAQLTLDLVVVHDNTAQEKLDAVLRLAQRWEERGRSDVVVAETMPDDVAESIRDAGKELMEKAFMLRRAVDGGSSQPTHPSN